MPEGLRTNFAFGLLEGWWLSKFNINYPTHTASSNHIRTATDWSWARNRTAGGAPTSMNRNGMSY